MKLLAYLFILLFALNSQAQYTTAQKKAYYTIPVPLALRAYAIFPIVMNDTGYSSLINTISFNLPLRLTGEPAITVTLTRSVENPTLWLSKDFTAVCSETKDSEFFNCQIYLLNKKLTDKKNLESYLQKTSTKTYHGNTYTDKDIQNQISVLDRFLTGEPAGTLVQKMTDIKNGQP